MSPERVLAALALATCVVMLLRLAIGERRRARLDAWVRRTMQSARHLAGAPRRRRDAARAAEEAIERARKRGAPGDGDWDGNVYRPKSFRKPPRDKMH